MGNSFSTSNALHVQLSRPWYYTGEVVEGVVALNAVDVLSTDGLLVQVTGIEKTTVNIEHYSSEGNDTSTHRGNVTNLTLTAPLAPQPCFQPGQYQFNFRVQLPDVIPPSISFYKNNGGEIHYTVAARARGLHAEQEFIVLGRPKPEQLRSVSEDGELAVNACCGSAGTVYIRLDLGRAAYGRGENINAIITVHNDSTNAYDNIEVYLNMIMTVSCNSGHHSALVEHKLASVMIPGVAPGERAEGPTARRAQLRVPLDAAPTVAAGSTVITCRHVLRAELPAGCCSTGARCGIPLCIVGGPFSPQQAAPPPQQIAYPPGWAPTVYPPVALGTPRPDMPWLENGPGPVFTAVQKPEMPGYGGSASPVSTPGTPQQQFSGSFYPEIRYSS